MHSLLPDLRSQDGGHRRLPRGADDTENWKGDHTMGPKEFSSDSLSKLVAVLGQKVMSLSLQTQILTSISIFQVDTTKDNAAQEEAKIRTTAYHNLWQTVPKEKRRGSPPPFILVIEASINISKLEVIEIYREYD